MSPEGPQAATDVEIDRVLNAINTTFNDQHPTDPPASRLQEIADGACGQERKLAVRVLSPSSFALDDAETHHHVATVEHTGEGKWTVGREREAHGSHVAVPGGKS